MSPMEDRHRPYRQHTEKGYAGKPQWEDTSLVDEALTLPLEDQDFRDRDFRHGEDVDERKQPWKGQRQKFPPPWAQDVDHRHNQDTGPPPSLGSEDRDFRHYPHGGDLDYRSRDYPKDDRRDDRVEYEEDQDYRAQERGHHRRRKKRRHSPEHSLYKKSRHHDRDKHYHRHEDKDDRGKKEEKSSQQKKETELPKPVPPPGVVPTSDPPPGGKSGHSFHRGPPPRIQPAPPGVDDWE